MESLSLLLLMRAFADGCSAMTGTEAISNGTPAFKPPEWKNAQATMVTMAVVLGVVFLGISYLATVSGAVPSEHESVLSQIGEAVFGPTPIYYVLIFSTMGILVLAAQTSFADFPRLASILAKDSFMPRRFAYRGERLAFNAGIVVLAAIAILVVVAFGGRVEALIPLYAIGVFTAFTLSQSGHGPPLAHGTRPRLAAERDHQRDRRDRDRDRRSRVRDRQVRPRGVDRHRHRACACRYHAAHPARVRERRAGAVRASRGADHRARRRQRVVVPLPDMRRDAIQAIKFGLTMSDRVTAVHVTDDIAHAEELRTRFTAQVPGVELLILESPYRELIQPLIRYLEMLAARDTDTVTIVLVPERIIRHWWERFLYNQNAHRIRDALTGHPGILVADVPFRRAA